jgi:uncharacterized protein (TIGR02246 family)
MSVGDDEHLIQDIISGEQAAWNAGDADALAARFHAEGSFTNVFGDRYFGRESFRARHAAIFNTFAKGSKASLTVRRIHFPTPGTAVVDIDCVLEAYAALPPGLVPAPDGTLRTSLLQVLVKERGEWWTVGYHDVDVKPLPAGARS